METSDEIYRLLYKLQDPADCFSKCLEKEQSIFRKINNRDSQRTGNFSLVLTERHGQLNGRISYVSYAEVKKVSCTILHVIVLGSHKKCLYRKEIMIF